ncbi:protein of unknown function (plasmid) [Cupriavidus taiwanensis]|uniref:Uncharacterized protein n=1 Tax=Cupriavidus taiwanensis TaxID=164546 RepID=A0A9Q7XWN9_9BURK|nr:protein of unknown function [Cupriavidus taiwanensis]
MGGSGGGGFRLGVVARSTLLRYVSQGRCLRSLTIERSQQGVGSLLRALLVGRLRLRCARSQS